MTKPELESLYLRTMTDLGDAVRRLNGLLSAREYGLVSWNLMVASILQEVVNVAATLRIRPDNDQTGV